MTTQTETTPKNSAFGIPHSPFPWSIPDEAPWPDPVAGAPLLDELVRTIRRFVVLPAAAADTLALWILHTHAFELGDVSAYLGIESPEKRCGKTTLLAVLSELVNRPVVAANISSPAFFRVIEETRPTLLIDEADTFLRGNDELRGILNSGYRRQTAYVVRVTNLPAESSENVGQASRLPLASTPDSISSDLATDNDNPAASELQPSASVLRPDSFIGISLQPSRGSSLARFSCWCPKAIAAIGRLPETLADRCIVIRMQRKTEQEECERLRHLDASTLRRQCARFVLDHATAIADARPKLPAELHDRAGDIWEPLLVLADLAGGPWPERARRAAVTLSVGSQESNPIASLLLDLVPVLARQPDGRALSRHLAAWLNTLQDRPWAELRKNRPVTELWLAQILRPYGVRPRTFWREGRQVRGYAREDFAEIFQRYISKSDLTALLPEPAAGSDPNHNPNRNPNPPAQSGSATEPPPTQTVLTAESQRDDRKWLP